MLPVLKSFALLNLLFGFVCLRVATAAEYYVDDRGSINKATAEDLTQVQAEEWQVRLYRKGQTTGGRNHWGLITGSTAESVMKKLRKSQAFQKACAKFFNLDYTQEELTYFNYLGPIAVFKKVKPGFGGLLPDLEKVQEKVKFMLEIHEHLETILQTAPKEPTFAKLGQGMNEYLENLQDSCIQTDEVSRQILENTESSFNRLREKIDRILDSIQKSEKFLTTLHGQTGGSYYINNSYRDPKDPERVVLSIQRVDIPKVDLPAIAKDVKKLANDALMADIRQLMARTNLLLSKRHYANGNYAEAASKLSEAETEIKSAVDYLPASTTYRSMLQEYQKQRSDWSKASYEQAIQYQRSDRYVEAQRSIDTALQFEPSNALYWNQRGIYVSKQGNDKEKQKGAFYDFQRAYKLDSNNSTYRKNFVLHALNMTQALNMGLDWVVFAAKACDEAIARQEERGFYYAWLAKFSFLLRHSDQEISELARKSQRYGGPQHHELTAFVNEWANRR